MPVDLASVIIPVATTLSGALVAGFASYFAGRGMRSHDWRLGIVRERLFERQRLYARFVAEADRNVLIASGGAGSIDNAMPLFALYAEVEMLGSAPVRVCAKRVCDLRLSANAAEAGARGDSHYEARTAFAEAAREELATIELDQRSGRRRVFPRSRVNLSLPENPTAPTRS